MLIASLALSLSTLAPNLSERPKLVVVISIDQFRADYIRRYGSLFIPAKAGGKTGGFKYLLERGADYADAHHAHVPTATGPGHAAILSGSAPAINGIIANDWFDPATGKAVYCVDDAGVATVGGVSKPMSPKNLLTTTVGDELKLSNQGKSHLVSVSFKDRAAILLAGHAADTVIWLDTKSQNWVTSTWYAKSGALPGWVSDLNGEKAISKDLGKNWVPVMDDASYSGTKLPPVDKPNPGGRLFDHKLASVSDFTTSSFGQEYVFTTAERALDAEQLGHHAAPDILTINLATNDYVGHMYGPDSPEAEDITVRTDRLLGDLFTEIDKKVGLGNTVIAVTADHGVVPIPEDAQALNIPAKRWDEDALAKAIDAGLSAKYGQAKWVLAVTEPNLYLDDKQAESRHVSLAELRAEAARIANTVGGVFCAFTADDILAGRLPKWRWTDEVSLGYNAKRGGDLVIVPTPGDYVGGGNGTGHGTPWAYDTHVPLLLAGPGIKAGHYFRHVTIPDLAPTLCQLLGIEYTTGNIGSPLFEALGN